jgi:hypothetical protein
MTEPTGETVDLTPIFNYHRDVEIVKRFLEQLTAMQKNVHAGDVYRYLDDNLIHARNAMSGIMADDIERQIQITKDFPLRPQLFLHQFVGEDLPGDWPIGKPEPVCTEDDCYVKRGAMVHTL